MIYEQPQAAKILGLHIEVGNTAGIKALRSLTINVIRKTQSKQTERSDKRPDKVLQIEPLASQVEPYDSGGRLD